MRIQALDFLRGIAILLVLFRHGTTENLLHRVSWVGVDLFFVLSGFLVSSILFKEYIATQKIDITRFLIRRGFKIYPGFYFFVLVFIAIKFFYKHEFYDWHFLLSEIFYLQNYLPGIWLHTWTLAVQEHFYIVLPFLVYASIQSTVIARRKMIIGIMLASLLLTFLMRLMTCYPHRDEKLFIFFQTHLRMDGILVGVLLAYLYYFTEFFQAARKNGVLSWALTVLLIAPVFIFDGGGFFMNTVGLSSVNLGFGLLVLLLLEGGFTNRISKSILMKGTNGMVSFIGVHSYAIYLWHIFAQSLVNRMNLGLSSFWTVLLYIFASIGIGVFFTFVVEKPFLRIRDRHFGSTVKN